MILDRVTVTGADDSIEAEDLVALSEEFPFAEWGILFSASRQGEPRYPSKEWIADLWKYSTQGLTLSAHLCGRWARDLVLKNDFSWLKEYGQVCEMFKRIQINFHGHFLEGHAEWPDNMRRNSDKQYILQYDGANDSACDLLMRSKDYSAVPLFDRSGGAGIVPGEWPKLIPDIYCGYAGGLGPDNLAEEMIRIEKAAGEGRIWIDAETRVRSEDDKKFDLSKVCRFLDIAKGRLGSQSFIRR